MEAHYAKRARIPNATWTKYRESNSMSAMSTRILLAAFVCIGSEAAMYSTAIAADSSPSCNCAALQSQLDAANAKAKQEEVLAGDLQKKLDGAIVTKMKLLAIGNPIREHQVDSWQFTYNYHQQELERQECPQDVGLKAGEQIKEVDMFANKYCGASKEIPFYFPIASRDGGKCGYGLYAMVCLKK